VTEAAIDPQFTGMVTVAEQHRLVRRDANAIPVR
jgi:hypothetical protein